ncbi:MAG: DUF2007 domain-containing protein [bacterium]
MQTTIRTFSNSDEAAVYVAFLESQGIKTSLLDAALVNNLQIFNNAIGGIRLQVAEADAAKAEELLAHFIPEKKNVETVKNFDGVHCPFCRSNNISIDNGWLKNLYRVLIAFVFPVLSIFSLGSINRNKKGICYDCEKHWKYK